MAAVSWRYSLTCDVACSARGEERRWPRGNAVPGAWRVPGVLPDGEDLKNPLTVSGVRKDQ